MSCPSTGEARTLQGMRDATGSTVGDLLRRWRHIRGVSQLEVSAATGISTRHLSRVETGRSRPSAQLVLRLAEHLEVPTDRRDQLLLGAGHAPRAGALRPDSPTLEQTMDGLRRLLDAHMPSPALLLDEHWDVIDANPGAMRLLRGCDPALLEPPVNVVRLCVDPRGLAPRIANLAEWAGHLRSQVRARAVARGDDRLWELLDDVGDEGDVPVPPTEGPILPLRLDLDGQEVCLLSVTARLETARDTALEGLRLEVFLPADEASRLALLSAAGGEGATP